MLILLILAYIGVHFYSKKQEEKENARKLHAVKMIEKYYTWLNDEEVGILERMLEDCKRRKREYAIEEG